PVFATTDLCSIAGGVVFSWICPDKGGQRTIPFGIISFWQIQFPCKRYSVGTRIFDFLFMYAFQLRIRIFEMSQLNICNSFFQVFRSEERRVGKGCRSMWWQDV